MKRIQQTRAIATPKKISLLPGRRHAALLVPLSLLAVAPGCRADELTCEETKTCRPGPAGAAGEAGAGGATLQAGEGGASGTGDAGFQAGATSRGGRGGAPGDAGSESDDEATGGRRDADTGGTSDGGDEETTGGAEAGPEEAGSAGEGAGGAGGAGTAGSSARGGAALRGGSGSDSAAASGSDSAGQAGAASRACMPSDVRCDPQTGVPQLCSDELTWEDRPRCQYVCIDGFCAGECTPGKRRCDTGSGIPQLCNAAGEWNNQDACGKGAACAAGECVCTSAEMTECDGTCIDLDTSADDCGACGHSCLGGECLEGKCQPLQVAEGLTVQSRISLDSTHVYWMSENAGGVIWRVPKAGGSVREVVGDIGTPGAFALSDARIYWGDRAYLGSIFRAKVDGSNVEPFTGKWGGVDAMLVVGDTLYWNEQLSGGGTNLASIPVAGAAAPDTFVSVSDSFSWFTMADGCLFYYANGSGNTLMRSCGASPEPVYAAPEALDLAPHGSSDASYLYFGSDGEGVMRLSLTDASSPDLLAHGTKTRYVIVDSGTLYYVEGDPPDVPACTSYWGIYSIPKTGGTPTELVGPPTQCPSYLAADAEAIYWVDTDNGLLMRLAK